MNALATNATKLGSLTTALPLLTEPRQKTRLLSGSQERVRSRIISARLGPAECPNLLRLRTSNTVPSAARWSDRIRAGLGLSANAEGNLATHYEARTALEREAAGAAETVMGSGENPHVRRLVWRGQTAGVGLVAI